MFCLREPILRRTLEHINISMLLTVLGDRLDRNSACGVDADRSALFNIPRTGAEQLQCGHLYFISWQLSDAYSGFSGMLRCLP